MPVTALAVAPLGTTQPSLWNARCGFGFLTRLALVVALVLAAALPSAAQPVRIAFIYSDGNLPGTLKAYKAVLAERPDLKGRVTLTFLTESMFDEVEPAELTSADVLMLDIMNQQMLDRYNAKHKVDLIAAVRRRGRVFAIGEGLLPQYRYVTQGVVYDDTARALWAHSGLANQVGLIKFALVKAGIRGLSVPKAEPSLSFGYYYPDGRGGRVFATWDEFTAWKRANGKSKPGATRVALGFYKSSFYSGETELLDAVIAEIERRGAEAVPFFGYPDAMAASRMLADPAGAARADVALALLFRFAGPEASPILEKLDIPVVNLISLYGRSEQEWRASSTGLSLFEGTFQVAVPELAGLVAPTVIGSQEKVRDADTGLTVVVRRPIASQVAMAVERGLRYAALRARANRDKRVAVVFYDYPAGRANIGASYLNVATSIARILQRLAAEGYDVGSKVPTSDVVLKDVTQKARNVGGYAPGELQALVAQGSAVRVPMADYRRWLNEYTPALREKVLADWGPPETSRLMTVGGSKGPSIVVPVVQYGNIALLPQPARGWGEDREKMYHAKDLAPPHQYVATYAWLRSGYRADAVVHVGTHGTLEWLDGKDIGLSPDDASDALMAGLPDLYIYNVDVVGEGLVARRRGMATLVDHMVPPFKKGGLYTELAELGEAITDFGNRKADNAELARTYAERIRAQLIGLGIAKDLGLRLDKPGSLTEDVLHDVEEHLLELKGQNIPYGLHTFGLTPDKPLRDTTIDAIVSVDRSLLPDRAKVLAAEMEQRIVASGPRELDSLVRALRGGFVGTGGGGEPIRNPDAYPTGRNFYGIDPDKVPKPASWDLGVTLAKQMLDDHVRQHKKYPDKVSFVIWGDETMRHEGVIESQIFYLLGTRPVWDDRGKVVDVRVIPRAQLNRPRVDIVIASAAEGMFSNVTRLMDEAVQRVKALDEADNVVRRHYLSTKATLISRGYSEDDADRRAGVRIFDEAPGIFNLNTSTIAAASGTWDSDKGMADDYLRKLGHAYGNGFWGEPMQDVFRLALSGTEKIVHSSSTSLYGALDNDDFFMYMGGLATAVRSLDGKTPEMVVTNTRDPGRPEMTTIEKFIGTEFRSRYVNPTWIEGMKKEGYAGAGEMRSFVEYLWGWDATAPEVIDDSKWKETFDVYVEDKHELGMAEFFERHSPFAYQDMTARMVETVRKGYWKADAATTKKLLEEYVGSVGRHGVGCAEHTCGNPRLQKYVLDEGRRAGIPVPALDGFQRAMEKATGARIEPAAEDLSSFATHNDAQMAENLSKVPAISRMARQLKGYLMEERRNEPKPPTEPTTASRGTVVRVVLTGAPIIALLIAWRWRRRRR
jgi:cobaltochelatase CobN